MSSQTFKAIAKLLSDAYMGGAIQHGLFTQLLDYSHGLETERDHLGRKVADLKAVEDMGPEPIVLRNAVACLETKLAAETDRVKELARKLEVANKQACDVYNLATSYKADLDTLHGRNGKQCRELRAALNEVQALKAELFAEREKARKSVAELRYEIQAIKPWVGVDLGRPGGDRTVAAIVDSVTPDPTPNARRVDMGDGLRSHRVYRADDGTTITIDE
jgi:hypothetical protein